MENAYFFANVGWDAGMRHTCGEAGERFGSAEAHRELKEALLL